MIFQRKPAWVFWLGGLLFLLNLTARGQDDDQTGIKIFRAATTNLYGTGIRVAQIEADGGEAAGAQTFEVNPANTGNPANIFTYISSAGTSSIFPNNVGVSAYHPDRVGQFLYGTISPGQTANGVATNVAHVDVADASYFFTYKVELAQVNYNDPIICQSYSFGTQPVSTLQALDSYLDNYATLFNVLFVSAAGPSGSPTSPASPYNTLTVGAYGPGSSSATGPTPDNGRCKPDMTAPDAHTSFSAPQVAGAAAD